MSNLIGLKREANTLVDDLIGDDDDEPQVKRQKVDYCPNIRKKWFLTVDELESHDFDKFNVINTHDAYTKLYALFLIAYTHKYGKTHEILMECFCSFIIRFRSHAASILRKLKSSIESNSVELNREKGLAFLRSKTQIGNNNLCQLFSGPTCLNADCPTPDNCICQKISIVVGSPEYDTLNAFMNLHMYCSEFCFSDELVVKSINETTVKDKDQGDQIITTIKLSKPLFVSVYYREIIQTNNQRVQILLVSDIDDLNIKRFVEHHTGKVGTNTTAICISKQLKIVQFHANKYNGSDKLFTTSAINTKISKLTYAFIDSLAITETIANKIYIKGYSPTSNIESTKAPFLYDFGDTCTEIDEIHKDRLISS